MAPDPIAEAVNHFRQHLREAIDASGESHKVIAAYLNVTPVTLAKMLALSGEQKNIGIHHLVALPQSVQFELVNRIADEMGAINLVELKMHISQGLIANLAGALNGFGVGSRVRR